MEQWQVWNFFCKDSPLLEMLQELNGTLEVMLHILAVCICVLD